MGVSGKEKGREKGKGKAEGDMLDMSEILEMLDRFSGEREGSL